MKRYIKSSSKSNKKRIELSNDFVEKLLHEANNQLPDELKLHVLTHKYDVGEGFYTEDGSEHELQIGPNYDSCFRLDNKLCTTTIPSRLYSYYQTNDLDSAVSYLVNIITQGVQDGSIILSENYLDVIYQYSEYFDKIQKVVADVASQHDSDLQWNWRLQFDNCSLRFLSIKLNDILRNRNIFFTSNYCSISYIGDIQVETSSSAWGYSFPDGEVKYEKENIRPVSLNIDNLESGLNEVRTSVQNYFDIVLQLRENKSSEPTRIKWSSILSRLNRDRDEDTVDYVYSICNQVDESLNLFVEGSLQGGRGSIDIYDTSTDECVLEGYDYWDFDDSILNLALNSKNMTEFKEKYKEYILSIIE